MSNGVFLLASKERIDGQLHRVFDQIESTVDKKSPLHNAMRYSAMSPGKRFRPALCLATAKLICDDDASIWPVACAVEMIHAYSLIHDDLPCMDDDDERRGQPSCHQKFGEATALLAGNALLTEAFGLICHPEPLFDCDINASASTKIVHILSRAVGASGMMLGQFDDLCAHQRTISESEFLDIHLRKTGLFIEAAVCSAAIACGATSREEESLRTYAQNLGLCFQLRDDLIDKDGMVPLLGEALVAKRATKALETALHALSALDGDAAALIELAECLKGDGIQCA